MDASVLHFVIFATYIFEFPLYVEEKCRASAAASTPPTQCACTVRSTVCITAKRIACINSPHMYIYNHYIYIYILAHVYIYIYILMLYISEYCIYKSIFIYFLHSSVRFYTFSIHV